ncbi:MAG TPA: MarR family transcriptional regulator [Solirubrobacteraceae bacterium]|nr:MarR family transcriptional regulator [Solirubrobacteraceae bacterium]
MLEAIDAAATDGTAAIADVARELGLDRSNASRTLADAVAAELVEKRVSAEDARRTELGIRRRCGAAQRPEETTMTIVLDHTIVPVADKHGSAELLAELIGREASHPAGPRIAAPPNTRSPLSLGVRRRPSRATIMFQPPSLTYSARMDVGRRQRALLGAGLAMIVLTSALVVSVASAARPVANCSAIPMANVPRAGWGFHGGAPITGAVGSYTRGHGTINLTARTATGIICQVDRVRNAPDRQIVLSVGHRVIYTSHTATMFGVAGNIMKINVRVKSTTDSNCPVGTEGQATIFASYNNVHEDSVQFSFPAACMDHRHRYTGPSVLTNVPPN